MELEQRTEQDLQALSNMTNQKPEKIIAQAVEQYMAETGKQLIRQQQENQE